MGRSEKEFWESTPRKVFALMDIHNKRHQGKSKNKNESKSTVKGETVRLKAVK